MRKMLTFAGRNLKEMVRDPLNLGFGLGFPVVVLLLLSAIQANIPVDLFSIESLTPGIVVFGFSFITLFSATIIAKDRSEAFLMRLFATPMRAADYIVGYTLPMIPVAVGQIAVCVAVAAALGLKLSLDLLWAMLIVLPSALFFIGFGLLAGSLLTDKQVGGVCGAMLTNMTAWLSGTWFDLELVGGWFKKIAYVFPFAHAVDAGRAAIAGDYAGVFPHIWWVLGWGVGMLVLAVVVFGRRMSTDKLV